MPADAAFFVRSWPVGPHVVTLTVPRPEAGAVMSVTVEWSAGMPHRLTASEIEQYRAGRNAAIADLAEQTGGRIAVVEA